MFWATYFNHQLKCLTYTGKMTSAFIMQPSILNVMHILSLSFMSKAHCAQAVDTGRLMRAMTRVTNLLLSVPFPLSSSSFLSLAYNIAQSIQRLGMETGLAFWSWFNLAVTPIADALKWLRRIVSAWWDLQLGGTSAPAAAPRHPLNLQIWLSQSLVLVGSQHKQFPLHNCE